MAEPNDGLGMATIKGAGRDPVTLSLRKPPEPTMDADTVVYLLLDDDGDDGSVREAIRSADAHRRALVDVLIEELEERLDDPLSFSGGRFPIYAFLLLAKWREPRAYPLVVRWLSLPYAGTDQLAGDLAATHGARILAGVCDGDLAPLLELALDERIDADYRSVAVRALALLAAWREVPRDHVVDALSYLARVGLERKRSKVWLELVEACRDVEAVEVVPALRFASADRLIDRSIHPPEAFEMFEECSGCWLDLCQFDYPPIVDVVEELEFCDQER